MAADDPRPVIWLTLRPVAADAQWVARSLLDALVESGLVEERVTLTGSVSWASWPLSALPIVEDLVAAAAEPVVVVDDAGAATGKTWECLVDSVALSRPAGSQMVVATRGAVPAHTLWRLRGRGQVAGFGSVRGAPTAARRPRRGAGEAAARSDPQRRPGRVPRRGDPTAEPPGAGGVRGCGA